MDPRHLQFAVLRAQAGDRAALDELLRTMQDELHGYLARLTGDAHLAEDLLQDTFVILCRKIRWLREPEFFRTWLYRIATREAMRRLRAERRRRAVHLDDLPDQPSTSPPARPDPDELRRILARVESLPPNSRAIILLHYGAGLSLSAAADALGVPEGTAKSRLAYALGLLRQQESCP